MKLKDIFSFSGILNTFQNKKLWDKLLIIFYPLISITIIFNVILLIATVAYFQLPNRWYIPFMGGYIQTMFDRFMIVVGIVAMFLDKDDN